MQQEFWNSMSSPNANSGLSPAVWHLLQPTTINHAVEYLPFAAGCTLRLSTAKTCTASMPADRTAYVNVQPWHAAAWRPCRSTARTAPTYAGYFRAMRRTAASTAALGFSPCLMPSTTCAQQAPICQSCTSCHREISERQDQTMPRIESIPYLVAGQEAEVDVAVSGGAAGADLVGGVRSAARHCCVTHPAWHLHRRAPDADTSKQLTSCCCSRQGIDS